MGGRGAGPNPLTASPLYGYCHTERSVLLHPPHLLRVPRPGGPQYDFTFTFIERSPRPVNVARPTPLWFHIPTGGPATHTGLGALSMKVEYLQGASPSVKPLTHTNFIHRYKGAYTSAGRGCPQQSSFQSVYCHPPPWCGQHFPAMGQRVN